MRLFSTVFLWCLLISVHLTLSSATEGFPNVKTVVGRAKRDPAKPTACETACHQKGKGEAYYACVKKDCGYHR